MPSTLGVDLIGAAKVLAKNDRKDEDSGTLPEKQNEPASETNLVPTGITPASAPESATSSEIERLRARCAATQQDNDKLVAKLKEVVAKYRALRRHCATTGDKTSPTTGGASSPAVDSVEETKLRAENQKLRAQLKAGWAQYNDMKARHRQAKAELETLRGNAGGACGDGPAPPPTPVVPDSELQRRLVALTAEMRETRAHADALEARLDDAADAARDQAAERKEAEAAHARENARLVSLLAEAKRAQREEVERSTGERARLVEEARRTAERLAEAEARAMEVERLRRKLDAADRRREADTEEIRRTDLAIIGEVRREADERVAVLRTRADEAEARAEDLRRRLRTAMTAREQAERRTRAVQQQLADSQRQVEIGKTQIMQLSQLTSARSA
jgi:hypothetical protein